MSHTVVQEGQRWRTRSYQTHAGPVLRLGKAVIDLLAPRSGEHMLDLGCGDGVLTQNLTLSGALVTGVDSSSELVDAASLDPWYFPTVEDYARRLRVGGFQIRYIELIPRPTPLPTDMRGWLETFAEGFIRALPADRLGGFLDDVSESLRPALCGAPGSPMTSGCAFTPPLLRVDC